MFKGFIAGGAAKCLQYWMSLFHVSLQQIFSSEGFITVVTANAMLWSSTMLHVTIAMRWVLEYCSALGTCLASHGFLK